MDPYWSNVFEYFKDRRLAGAFFRMLMIVITLLVASVLFHPPLAYTLAILAGIFLIWVWRGIRQALARRRDRYKSSPLSRDELKKARSKLVKVKH